LINTADISRSSLVLVAVALLLSACATQRPPEGGPVDSEPPVVVNAVPSSGTVGFRGREVIIEFNERIDQRSFDEAVHISPRLDKPPVYDWSARELTIQFQDELPEDKTIVITIGSNLKDLRAGNAMSGSYQLAFSTGDSLDRARIQGAVLDAKPAGVSIFAYLLNEGRADTLDPTKHRPDYVVRTGEDGRFVFSYLRSGSYRVFAVRDNLNNLLYDVEADEIGMPSRDVFAEDSSIASLPLRFTLHREDTTAPYVQRVTAISSRLIKVAFSEDVVPFPPTGKSLLLSDSASGESVPIITTLRALQGRNTWDVYLDTAIDGRKYALQLDSLRDASGNIIRTSRFIFEGSSEADTMRPALLEIFPKDGAAGVPKDSAFVLRFSRPLLPEVGVQLFDSTGTEISVTIVRPDMTRVEIQHPVLSESAKHRLCLKLATMRDAVTRRTLADSVYCVNFTTGKEGAFGTVTGNFVRDSLPGVPHILLREAKDGGAEYRTIADSTGAFAFSRVQEGRYRIEAFLDANGDGRFSPGSHRPLLPPELVIRYQDTLRVRSRWETSGVVLKVGK